MFFDDEGRRVLLSPHEQEISAYPPELSQCPGEAFERYGKSLVGINWLSDAMLSAPESTLEGLKKALETLQQRATIDETIMDRGDAEINRGMKALTDYMSDVA